MLTTAGKTLARIFTQENNPPVIDSTPAPFFTQGVADTHDMTPHRSDPDGDTLITTLQGILPNGLSYADPILTYDGIGAATTSTGHTITADDGEFQVTSSAFPIVVADTSVQFDVQALYEAIVLSRGGIPVPITNTRYWTIPTYPTVGTVFGSVAALNAAIATAAPFSVLFLANAGSPYNAADIVVPADRTDLIIAAETKLGVRFTGNANSVINGKRITFMGFDWSNTTNNGSPIAVNAGADDALIAYCRFLDILSVGKENTIDGDAVRTRITQNLFDGKTSDGTFVKFVDQVNIPEYCRIDHNHFLNHQGAAGGGSEVIQVGQAQNGVDHFCLIDSNYIYRHLNDGLGNKTVTDENETVTLKSDNNLMIRNVVLECCSHLNVRAGRKATGYANFIIGGGAESSGGIHAGGADNLIAMNYMEGLNPTNASGGSAIDLKSGQAGTTNEAADNNEVSFNTMVNCFRLISMGRSARPILADGIKFFNSAGEKAGAQDAIWNTNSTNTTYGGMTLEPTVGVADGGILAQEPDLTLLNGFWVPTVAGNCHLNGAAGWNPLITQDILGNPVPLLNPNRSCFQPGFDLTVDPIQDIIDKAGVNPV